MGKRPGFVLGSSLILGLALGANVAAFAILYGYLFRPLPYAAPGELWVPREQVLKWHLLGPRVSPHFFDMVRQLPQFRDAALWSPDYGRVETNDASALEAYGVVTPSIFTLLGVKPVLGRTLSFASGRPSGPPEAVLSYAFWQRAFAASPHVLGQSLRVDGRTLRIVGVMPSSFGFTGSDAAFWVPFVMTPALAHSENVNPHMLIRRPPGWTLARLDSVLRAANDPTESPAQRAAGDRESGFVIDAVPYRSFLLDELGGTAPFWALWAATLALLVVAALNALNLAVARQRERTGELHLREVLGCTADALTRMVLTEYAPVPLAASVLAAAFAASILRLVHARGLISHNVPFHVAMDSTAVAYLAGLAVTMAGSLAAATVAAVLLGRRGGIALQQVGARSSAGRGFKRTQAVFAAAQIGIALVLAICATLFTQSLLEMLQQPLHYDGTHVTVAQVLLPDTASPANFWREARPSFEALPGAKSAGLSSMIPFGETAGGGEFQPIAGRHVPTWAWIIGVGPGFFSTLGIHPLAGRLFRSSDQMEGESAVLISEALGHAFFGQRSTAARAVGGTLDPNMRIVGVVPAVPWRLDPRDNRHGYAVYVPLTSPLMASQHLLYISVESNAAPAVLFPAIRHALARLQPDAAVASLHTLPQMLQQASFDRKTFAWLIAGFGGLALIIAVFGVYAVVAYGVRIRIFELAIREVLGATRGAILRMVMREVAVLFAASGSIGAMLAFIAARLLSAELYGIRALDPLAYIGSIALVGTAVLIATLLPALRATHASPAEIMRR